MAQEKKSPNGLIELDFFVSFCVKTKRKRNVLKKIACNLDLWEISKFSSGMYIFRIKVKDLDGNEHEVDGKLVVV